MAFVLKDRVRETTSTNGTGAIYPSGVVTGGYQTFNSVLSNGDTTLCLVKNAAGQWQTFLGTWNSATQSMARTTIYDGSSGAGVAVGFSGESQEIWINYPANAYHNPQIETLLGTKNIFGNSSTVLPAFKTSYTLAGGYTGSGTNGLHLHELLLNTGNYTVGTAGTLINTYIGSVVGGSLATGDHVALQAQIDQTSATANLGEYIVAGVLQATANSNAGGTAITTNGSVFGSNVIAQIKTGATYFNSIIGTEIDIVAKEAVLDKIGLALVPWVGDTTSGSRTDALLVFGRNVSSSVGMDYGAVFGSPLGWWPIKSTGTLIGAPYTENASLPPGPAKQAAYGIDFSPVTFSTAAWKSAGFTIDGLGRLNQTLTNTVATTITPFITANQTINGTYSSGSSFQNNWNVADTLDASTTGSSVWQYYQHSMNSGFKGGRSSMRVNSYIMAQPSDFTSNRYYVGFNGEISVRADLSSGGVNYGTFIGLTYEANVKNGAKGGLVEAVELGAGVEAGGAASKVNVLKLSPLGGGIAPTTSYNGMALSHVGAGQGFFVGIAIGGQEGTAWPISTTGKIMAITDPSGSPAKTVDYGIDFVTVACTFTTAAFASPGFKVDGSGTVTTTGRIGGTRVVTAAGAVTVTSTDETVVINKTVGAATTVNLPAGVTGRTYVFKDGKGDAAVNNITITPAAGTIDSAATLVINTNYGRITLIYNGTEWNRIG